MNKLFLFLFLSLTTSYAAPLPDTSIYQMNPQCIDQSDQAKQFRNYQGKNTVLAFIYLGCQFTCPTIVSKVVQIHKHLGTKAKDTHFVFLTIDPKNDTTPVMRDYAKKRELPADFQFLNCQKESKIRALSAALNFKYKREKNGDYTHSYLIVALDKDGVPQARIESADQDSKEFEEKLK